MLKFLPQKYQSIFNKIDIDKLNEIRIRKNYPVIYKLDNVIYKLMNEKGEVIATNYDINSIIDNLTEKSIYAYNDFIRNGYLTTNLGVRVGLAGSCVFENEKIITVKDFSSLCIRIPHDIIGCSNYIFNKYINCKRLNILIVSPPGFGKTTILKDLVRNYNVNSFYNLLVIDERGELNLIGQNVDVIRYSNKEFALNYAIKSMSPDILFMDELMREDEFIGIKKASLSGVNVIATIHSDNVENVVKKFTSVKEIFDYYVVLKCNTHPGEILGVFDKNLNEI